MTTWRLARSGSHRTGVVFGLATALVLGCSVRTECPAGAEQCDCAFEHACDPGLVCHSGLCVREQEADRGSGGTQSSGTGGTSGGGMGASGGSAGLGATAASSDAKRARVKFCSEVAIDGDDATLRLTVLDKTLDAFTGECSPCQDLPTEVLLDFELLVLPSLSSLGSFQQVMDPGDYVWLATVENGEGALKFGTVVDSTCDRIDPFRDP